MTADGSGGTAQAGFSYRIWWNNSNALSGVGDEDRRDDFNYEVVLPATQYAVDRAICKFVVDHLVQTYLAANITYELYSS